MAALRKEVKLFIVRSLAQFNTPEETAKLVNEEYKNLSVSRQQCERYDPTKRAGKDLSAELKVEFEATRNDFLNKPQNIPIANLSVRLQRLENQYQKHWKNRVAALSILKQAAEDMGGKYTNRQEITGKDGESLKTTVVHATQAQVDAAVKKAQEEY
ncbi:DUF2280 domain-containing protein [Acinetobacter sp. WCHAc010052]|uniref:DUF2280 domain-containing protein n=1 Tax=Acinetobacter sp. WCHAc010052 TaxID=2004647 RepID=UPI000B3CDA88|nr:DUF2280 domain-containing protein [Acinetobacter sp. WCHAc010052]AXY61754.1 DUF2280 domain-containing protein [Acinetobacter sp. WCHAc010052]